MARDEKDIGWNKFPIRTMAERENAVLSSFEAVRRIISARGTCKGYIPDIVGKLATLRSNIRPKMASTMIQNTQEGFLDGEEEINRILGDLGILNQEVFYEVALAGRATNWARTLTKLRDKRIELVNLIEELGETNADVLEVGSLRLRRFARRFSDYALNAREYLSELSEARRISGLAIRDYKHQVQIQPFSIRIGAD